MEINIRINSDLTASSPVTTMNKVGRSFDSQVLDFKAAMGIDKVGRNLVSRSCKICRQVIKLVDVHFLYLIGSKSG